MSATPKRAHSVIYSDSSPEESEPKKLNSESNMEATLKSIKEELKGIGTIKALCESTKSTVELIQNKLDSMATDIKTVESRCDTMELELNVCKQENTILNNKLKQLEERSLNMEAYSRRDNIIITGITESASENITEKVQDFLKFTLKCTTATVDNMDFVRVHRLGNRKKVIVRFQRYKDKEYVWGQRTHLKGNQQYWMEEDFPVEIRNRRQVLLPIYKSAKNAKIKCMLIKDKLIINSQSYGVDNLHLLPEALKLENTSLIMKNDSVYFYSRASPLSTFFPADFVVNGVKYNCTEQYLQSEKARLHSDIRLENQIMMSNDPAKMVALGDKIQTDPNKWTDGKKSDIMRKALTENINQNDHLKRVLIATESKKLVLCAPHDSFWGIGMGIKEALKSSTEQWNGYNNLGTLMAEVRASLV